MASLNKVQLIGNLGQDPEIRYTPAGAAVANFSIATSESWKDKESGQKQTKTEWHRIVVWGKLAEICGEYLHKGKQVYIEGSLQTRKWQDKEGNDKYTTEIKAFTMQMLGSKGDIGGGQTGGGQGHPQPGLQPGGQNVNPGGGGRSYPQAGGFNDNIDDDIPF